MQPIHASGGVPALSSWMVAFSRRPAQESQYIDLNGLILRLRRHLHAILPENIELNVALEPNLKPLIADESALQEAIIHLVLRARYAMPEGGKLALETVPVERRRQRDGESSSNSYLLLRVTERRITSGRAHRPMVDPFEANDPDLPASESGLAAVYGIVKQAGGWMSVHAEEDMGSSVEIFLPCANDCEPTTV